ncbi:MerR family transcriptional regulator [Cetobacterium sp. SF1]|uniref:MerR family transcriptional regulator n=1 Tax=unclassified Cetobacterium TaxID=2630983 RepID=UPI003CFA7903
MKKEKYYIGEVEKICGIAKKTLRFYDKIGLLSPCEVSSNGYRYYNKENLYAIPVIKYYKQSGFTLENIKQAMNDFNYRSIEENFESKIKDLEEIEKELIIKKQSLEDWNSLIREARMVIEHNLTDIKVKYMERDKYLYLDQEFQGDYINTIINIDFTNYVERLENAITGPVIIEFSSLKDKLENKNQKIKILQKNLLKCKNENLEEVGGYMVISSYHIGSHEDIDKSYERIMAWAELHNYKYEDCCYERYVMDYWTTKDEKKYVTEIMLKLKTN